MVNAAHEYIKRGWKVVRLHHITETGACSCGGRPKPHNANQSGKHPVEKEWQIHVLSSAADVEATWESDPKANPGLATGTPSGFWVLDIDPKDKGPESLAQLLELAGETGFDTYTVETGSGGLHYYFLMPDFELGNGKGELKTYTGIDVRGTGGQVVAPPSVTAIGSYKVIADVPLKRAPVWLEEMVRPKEATGSVVVGAPAAQMDLSAEEAERLAIYTKRVVDAEIGRLAACKVNTGPHYSGPPWNNTTFHVACTLIELANSPWSPYVIEQAYHDLFMNAPRDSGFTDEQVNICWVSAQKKVGANFRALPPAPAASNVLDSMMSAPGVRVDPAVTAYYGGSPNGDADPQVAGFQPASALLRSWDDLGNARRMSDRYGDRLRWVEEAQRWAVYVDGHWSLDATRTAHGWVQELLETLVETEGAMYDDIKQDADDKTSPREAFVKWAKAQRMSGRVTACLKEASGRPELQASINDFDQHKFLLNVLNGVIDLTNGNIYPHDPSLLLMQQAPVYYDPSAPSPMWLTYLNQCQPDVLMRDYLQRILGYSLTASIAEQSMFLHWGQQGANGKSVMLEVVSAILGDYAQAVHRGTLMASQGGSSEHPTGLARMRGKRFLQVNEGAKGARLDEETIRNLTGDSVISARFMGKDFFEFEPTGKIHYITNHLPKLTDSNATWRRLHLIEWPVHLLSDEECDAQGIPRQRDKYLAQKILASEATGVLTWLVQGCVEWFRVGLNPPAVSRRALQEYRDDQDIFGQFLSEYTVRTPEDVRTPTKTLFDIYTAWAFQAGIKAMGKPDFTRAMVERKYTQYRSNTDRGFRGIAPRVTAGANAPVPSPENFFK